MLARRKMRSASIKSLHSDPRTAAKKEYCLMAMITFFAWIFSFYYNQTQGKRKNFRPDEGRWRYIYMTCCSRSLLIKRIERCGLHNTSFETCVRLIKRIERCGLHSTRTKRGKLLIKGIERCGLHGTSEASNYNNKNVLKFPASFRGGKQTGVRSRRMKVFPFGPRCPSSHAVSFYYLPPRTP